MPWNRLKIDKSPLFRRIIQPFFGTLLDALERLLGGCK